MRVAVTGATGNVGTSLLAALADEPAVEEIVAIARRLPGMSPPPKTRWVQADVSRDPLEGVLAGADCVVHLAWLIQPSRDLETLRATNVEGSLRVFRAAARAGVGAIVHASSIGAYSPGPKDRAVDESWPIGGIESSFYARHKAEVERLLDGFEREHPNVRVVRLRPALIFKREAASEIRRLFAGPLLPTSLVRREAIPIVPRHPRLVLQAVHSLDVADAYRRAIVGDARGAFNVAADPVLDADTLARVLGARAVSVPPWLLRAGAAASWRLRLQPTPEGWVDMGLAVPVMDSTRAREELGWRPARGADEALLELLQGIRDGAGLDTPPLAAGGAGPLRIRELVTGVGGRNP